MACTAGPPRSPQAHGSRPGGSRRLHRRDHRQAPAQPQDRRRPQHRHGGRDDRLPQRLPHRRRRRTPGFLQDHERKHQGHHHGRDVRRNGNSGVGDRVGDGGADEEPRGHEEGTTGAGGGGGARPEGQRGGHGQALLPQLLHQGDAAPPPTHPAPPARDGRGVRAGRLPRAGAHDGEGQRVGHRPRRRRLGRRRLIQAGEVRRRRGGPGFQGHLLRVHPLRLRPPILPRHAARPVRAGAGGGAAPALLQLGAARRHEALRPRHERRVRAHSSAGCAARRHALPPPQLLPGLSPGSSSPYPRPLC